VAPPSTTPLDTKYLLGWSGLKRPAWMDGWMQQSRLGLIGAPSMSTSEPVRSANSSS